MLVVKIRRLVQSRAFSTFIISVIVFAGLLVGLETDPGFRSSYKPVLLVIEHLITWIFVAEAALKILSHGDRPWRYFTTDNWNVFDFLVLVTLFSPINGSYIVVLRMIRVLRVLKLAHMMPRLRLLVNATLNALPSMVYITMLLGLVFYIYGVLGTFIFATNDPVHFGSLPVSILTLFRISTFEDWTDVMYLNMYGCDQFKTGNPYPAEFCSDPSALPWVGALYFVSFALLASLVVLNLFIGVITTSIEEFQEAEAKEAMSDATETPSHNDVVEANFETVQQQLQSLQLSVESIQKTLDRTS